MNKSLKLQQKLRPLFLLLCVLVLNSSLLACSSSSPQTNFYLLPTPENTRIDENSHSMSAVASTDLIHIAVLPAQMPEYLRRTQIFRKNPLSTNVTISDYNRWAEELDSAFQRVLSTSINNQLDKTNMHVTPQFRGVNADYTINVYVNSFEGDFNNDVVLDAYWNLMHKSQNSISDYFHATVRAGSNYESLIETQSELIELMAIEISKSLLKFESIK